MRKIKDEDMIGKRFGRLVVIQRAKDYVTPKGIHYDSWLCKCDCSSTKNILGENLRRGKSKSCGCMVRKKLENGLHTTHGQSHTKLNDTWYHMKSRCYNKNDVAYHNYGGRGITVCDEWIGENGFINFYNWAITNGHSDDLSLDRIDNNGGYSPENCRWATKKEQARNRRSNRYLPYNGVTKLISDWSYEVGISQKTISDRIDKFGWSIERALTEKVQIGRRKQK